MTIAVIDAILRHQLFLDGLKLGQANRLNEVMVKIDKDLRQTLSIWRYDELGTMPKQKLRELVSRLREIMLTSLDPYFDEMVKWFEFYMREDRQTFVELYSEYKPTEEVEEKTPDEKRLWGLVWAAPMAATGVLAAILLRNAKLNMTAKIERLVVPAYANNATIDELIASIRGTKAANYRDGELNRLYRATKSANDTIIQHIAAQVNLNVSSRLFEEYEWVSVIDNVTTQICRKRDGKRWFYGRGPVPPAHYGCRSSTVPVINGEADYADLTLEQWLRRQPENIRTDLRAWAKAARALTLEQFAKKRKTILQP